MFARGGGGDEVARVQCTAEGIDGAGSGGVLRDVADRQQQRREEGDANRATNARQCRQRELRVEVRIEGPAQEVEDEARRRGLVGEEIGQFVAIARTPVTRIAPEERRK